MNNYNGYSGQNGYYYPMLNQSNGNNGNKNKNGKNDKGTLTWLTVLFIVVIVFVIACIVGAVALIVTVSNNTDSSVFDDAFSEAFNNENAVGLKNPERYLGKNPGLNMQSIPTDDESAMNAEQVFEATADSIVEITVLFDEDEVDEYMWIGGYGSGIIMSSDGYIITNAHVLNDSTSKYLVRLYDGTEYEAEFVGADPQCDIGIIKIGAKNLKPASFAPSSELKVGETVFTIGNPGGEAYNHTICQGIISGLERCIQIEDTISDITYIQTDASINPGNSGGALINEYGQVVGINVASYSEFDNVGFAIPLDQVTDVIDDIFEYGYVPDRVKLGLYLAEMTKLYAEYNECSEGLEVVGISEESNFKKSGGKTDDIITYADGKRVKNLSELQSVISNKKPGDSIKLTLDRYNKKDDSYETYVIDVPLIDDTTLF